jgi:hypothetical protein
MTDQSSEQPVEPAASSPTPEADAGGAAPESEPASAPPPTFDERMERFGEEARQAGERWSKAPGVVRATDTAGRVWGLIVLAIGLWFFADVTLGYDMPSIAWRDLWPIVLIGIGLVVVVRGMTRRRA